MATIASLVDELAQMDERRRRQRLQQLLGAPTENKMRLHWRALLVTAMREAGLYPSEPKQ